MRESPYAPTNTKENENYTHYPSVIKCKQGHKVKKRFKNIPIMVRVYPVVEERFGEGLVGNTPL